MKNKAFTLIGLLVVIAIIGILSAILFPVFARARENARKAACMSNQKQIGLAIMQYTQDYDEAYPVCEIWDMDTPKLLYRWYQVIAPYVKNKQVFICPTSGDIGLSGGYGWNIGGTDGNNGFGYRAYDDAWMTPSGTGPVKLSEVDEPSASIMLTDPSSNGYSANGSFVVSYSSLHYIPVLHGGQVGPFTGGIVAVAAGGGANYLFADGHVKWLSATQSWRSPLWNVKKN